jgi:hydrogenase-1 operon protein HyaF
MSAFADDSLVDALILEVHGLLQRLIARGEAGAIDLFGLPLSASCVSELEEQLGRGEITVRLDAAGHSEIRETGFAGVWWTRHEDEAGRVIALLIEVALVPEIIRADIGDVMRGARHLPSRTNFARHTARTTA